MESNIALNCLLPEIQSHQFNLYFSERVGASNSKVPALQYLDFLEREFILTKLFPKLESDSSGGFLSFKQISNKYGAPIMQLQEIRSVTTLVLIEAFKPDLFISIRFGKIFKGAILSIPPKGIINLHSAVLPDYKGVLGTFRAFMDGKDSIGSTIHYINSSSIDTGDILSIDALKVIQGRSVLWHVINIYPQAVSTLCKIINQVSQGKPPEATPQPAGGRYYSFPDENDFAVLNKKGFKIYKLGEYAQLLTEFYRIEKKWILDELKGSLPESF